MWVRKQIDIRTGDLVYGAGRCLSPGSRDRLAEAVEGLWSPDGEAIATLSVRSGFDLWLAACRFPQGTEILVSALTIPDMVRIIERHGLVPIPVDLDPRTMAPDRRALHRAVSPRTRAVLVAHLFGGRLSLDDVFDLAAEHDLAVIEDCAQAYVGPEFTGDPRSDVTMFSFGPIKMFTALGAGLLKVRDAAVLDAMHALHSTYPVQRRWTFLERLLKYAGIRSVCSRPIYGPVVKGLKAFGVDHDRVANRAVKGFAGDGFFERIRRRPCAPLLALLARRLSRFHPSQLSERREKGQALTRRLAKIVYCPGAEVEPHSYWVFPVLAVDPPALIAELQRAGFDATQGESMCVVSAPDDRPELEACAAAEVLATVVFAPFYASMPSAELSRMGDLIAASPAAASADSTIGPRRPVALPHFAAAAHGHAPPFAPVER